jgi:hypothetical protein
MKKIIALLTIVIALTTATPSCTKKSNTDVSSQNISQTIKANQAFEYDLGNFGDEEGATISKQATHFFISSPDRQLNTGKIIYTYQPVIGFTGTDEVELKSARGSNGADPNNKIIYTTIKFTVIN